MLLAVDIGNTTVSIGLIKNGKIFKVWQIETNQKQVLFVSKLSKVLTSIAQIRALHLRGGIICSVVPSLLEVIRHKIENKFKIKILVIGKDFIVPIKNLYRNRKQVGQDRLVGAYAALKLYGQPLIVIDFGTAITFDVVSKNKEYLGGIIIPGIRLSAESLYNKTALLPKIHIKPARELIGRDTKSSILSGIFYGYGALCTGLIERISRETVSKPKVIITGGYARVMQRYIDQKSKIVDFDLVFKGMELLFKLFSV